MRAHLAHHRFRYWLMASCLVHLALLGALALKPASQPKSIPPAALVVDVVQAPQSEKAKAASLSDVGKSAGSRPIRLGRGILPGPAEASRIETSMDAEGRFEGGEAWVSGTDKNFSRYRKLYEKVDGALTYPAWLRDRKEAGTASARIHFVSGGFQIRITSDSPLLQVQVTRMFRSLLADDLKAILSVLKNEPVYLYFTFSQNEAPRLEIQRHVHNNKLYYERRPKGGPKAVAFERTSHGGTNGASGVAIQFGIGFGAGSADRQGMSEEEFRLDPAYGQAEVILTGSFT